MAVERVSTSLVRFLGAEVKATLNKSKLSNLVLNGTGTENPLPAAVERLPRANLAPASVNIGEFQAVFGFLESRGASPLASRAMALVLVDAAKALGVSAMGLVEGASATDLQLLTAETYNYINQLRDETSQLASSNNVNNKKSFRSRYIIP